MRLSRFSRWKMVTITLLRTTASFRFVPVPNSQLRRKRFISGIFLTLTRSQYRLSVRQPRPYALFSYARRRYPSCVPDGKSRPTIFFTPGNVIGPQNVLCVACIYVLTVKGSVYRFFTAYTNRSRNVALTRYK